MNREQKAILNATPGRLLLEEFLQPYGLSQSELARHTARISTLDPSRILPDRLHLTNLE